MIQRLFNQFSQSSSVIRIALGAVIGIWALVVVALIAATVLLLERPGKALPPAEEDTGPARIALEPTAASAGASVTVRGEGWSPGEIVLIYLVAPGKTEPPPYAVAGSTADANGLFTNQFFVPSEPSWLEPGLAMVIAQASEGGVSAQAFFSVLSAPEVPVIDPTASIEPTVTPTEVPSVPTPTPQPGSPKATATTDVNIRSGPGTAYPVLGVLRIGQGAEITGVSADSGWWQIKFSAAADGRGWVSARYVSAENTGDVPLVQAPALPPAPTPTSTPVTIRDWRGEYYNNQNLTGSPVLVRNDVAVNFDWGSGAPASGIPADSFSVRWSRDVGLAAGTYRFYAYVDDGVRLWVDGVLVMDRWHDSAPTTHTVDVYLSDGKHSLRIEYYEHTGGALAQLAWERLEHYPDWKGEYFNNPDLSGVPALVRNDVGVNFSWGPNSPGPGVPADNFSARWSRIVHFSSGTYRFKVVMDDGARLWVDDRLVIDRWRVGDPNAYTGDVTLSEGTHLLRLEYFEFRYDAQVHLSWERVDSFQDWKGEYYDNRKLGGNPVLVRNDASINFNWENGSPGPDVPRDNFSARWTRKADFKDGTYVFSIWVDDGARLWIDDSLVIDGWRDGSVRLLQAERQLSQGTHRIKVEYYERGGAAQIALNWSRKQAPVNQPPQAVPGGPYTVDEGSLVNFDGSGSKDPDGKIAKYEWDFNYDGKTFAADAAGQTASTRYPDGPATIVFALRVIDDKGASHVATAQVHVKNVAPAVEAGGPYVGQAGSPITMAGTASDPGLIDQTGLVYFWDFGDGNGGNGPIVNYSYAQPGGYTVKLTVTDKDGAQGTDTASVQVVAANQPPTAAISGPSQGTVGEPLNFSGRDSADGDGHIQSYAWDFGDETKGGGVNVAHSYAVPGNYLITLTVMDNGGLTGKATHTIHITPSVPDNQPPTAVISGPAQGLVGETLSFNGNGSGDSDGTIVRYAWDFGDDSTGGGPSVTHSYATAGVYQITLTVTDNDGLKAVAKQPVKIQPLAPAPQPPTAVISGPVTAVVSQTVQFDASSSSDSDGSIVSYAWDFGDLTTHSGITVTHVYTQAGTYTVTLTVVDDDSLEAKTMHTIVVAETAAADAGEGAVP